MSGRAVANCKIDPGCPNPVRKIFPTSPYLQPNDRSQAIKFAVEHTEEFKALLCGMRFLWFFFAQALEITSKGVAATVQRTFSSGPRVLRAQQ
jgi:hypothetical protein